MRGAAGSTALARLLHGVYGVEGRERERERGQTERGGGETERQEVTSPSIYTRPDTRLYWGVCSVWGREAFGR